MDFIIAAKYINHLFYNETMVYSIQNKLITYIRFKSDNAILEYEILLFVICFIMIFILLY